MDTVIVLICVAIVLLLGWLCIHDFNNQRIRKLQNDLNDIHNIVESFLQRHEEDKDKDFKETHKHIDVKYIDSVETKVILQHILKITEE